MATYGGAFQGGSTIYIPRGDTFQAAARYRQDVINAYARYQEQQFRDQTTLHGLELQTKQLPQTLAMLEKQYGESLGTLNRLFETQNAMFDPQRKQFEAQQALQSREFQKKVGQVEASFGARGLAFSQSALGDMRRQSAYLDEIANAQRTMLDLEEKQTGIKQDQQRQDLEHQIENSRLSISQKLETVNQAIVDQKALQEVTKKAAYIDPATYGVDTKINSITYGQNLVDIGSSFKYGTDSAFQEAASVISPKY